MVVDTGDKCSVMNLLLFGAGASYGSTTVGGPPIGEALFDSLRSFNPAGWGSLPAAMAADFRQDFEKGMTRVAEQIPHAMPVLQRAMAAYFFKFVPIPENLYLRLAERIHSQRWTGVLASLNYERLLELSLMHAGVQPVVGQKAGLGQVELCLPHGCCHLFCKGFRASATGVSFSGTDVTFDGPVTVIGNPAQFKARLKSDAVPPVMSYFEPQKSTNAGASFIRGQRGRWRELALQAMSLAIVGVRCRPHDAHIWKPIAESDAAVVYCAGSRSGEEFNLWAKEARPGKNNRVLPDYFSQEFDSLCAAVGLA